MPFKAERLRGLREAKKLKAAGLGDIPSSTIRKLENGHVQPGIEMLERLAVNLDATTDYFLGLGRDFDGFDAAASAMSFDVLQRDLSLNAEQRERCRRVVNHPEAPRTVQSWKVLIELVELAVGSPPPELRAAKKRA